MPLVDKKLVTNPRPAASRPPPGDNFVMNPPPAWENKPVVSAPPTPASNAVRPSPVVDVESGAVKKECWVKNKPIVLIFRAVALLFSFISFCLMVSIVDFADYSSLSYVFAIVLMVVIYTVVFVGIHGHEVRTGKVVIPIKVAAWMNVLGDQILALFLLSAGSSAAEMIRILKLNDYSSSGVDQATASVALAFLTFLALEPAAIVSMYNLSILLSKS